MTFSEFVALVDDLVTPFGAVKLPSQFSRARELAGWQASDIHTWLYFEAKEKKPIRLGFSRIAGTLVIPDREHRRYDINHDCVRAVAHAMFQRLQQKVEK